MKKILSFLGSYSLFYIGHFICKVSHSKHKGKFIFDKKSLVYIGYVLSGWYQWFIISSTCIQDWGGKGPWKKVEKKNEYDLVSTGGGGSPGYGSCPLKRVKK